MNKQRCMSLHKHTNKGEKTLKIYKKKSNQYQKTFLRFTKVDNVEKSASNYF